MNQHPAQNEPAFLQAGTASEQRPEADLAPSSDQTIEDGQDGSTSLDQFINEGGNGRGGDSELWGLKLDPITMKAQTLMAEGVSLSQSEALQEFRKWTSAELLDPQRHWLGAESRGQKRTKADLLAGALGLWVHRHPKERLTKAGLFNVMREAVAEFMTFTVPSEAELAAKSQSQRL